MHLIRCFPLKNNEKFLNSKVSNVFSTCTYTTKSNVFLNGETCENSKETVSFLLDCKCFSCEETQAFPSKGYLVAQQISCASKPIENTRVSLQETSKVFHDSGMATHKET